MAQNGVAGLARVWKGADVQVWALVAVKEWPGTCITGDGRRGGGLVDGEDLDRLPPQPSVREKRNYAELAKDSCDCTPPNGAPPLKGAPPPMKLKAG